MRREKSRFCDLAIIWSRLFVDHGSKEKHGMWCARNFTFKLPDRRQLLSLQAQFFLQFSACGICWVFATINTSTGQEPVLRPVTVLE